MLEGSVLVNWLWERYKFDNILRLRRECGKLLLSLLNLMFKRFIWFILLKDGNLLMKLLLERLRMVRCERFLIEEGI